MGRLLQHLAVSPMEGMLVNHLERDACQISAEGDGCRQVMLNVHPTQVPQTGCKMQDKMRGFNLPSWKARPETAPNPGVLAAIGSANQAISRGSVVGLMERPPLAVRQSPPASRPHTTKGAISPPSKPHRVCTMPRQQHCMAKQPIFKDCHTPYIAFCSVSVEL